MVYLTSWGLDRKLIAHHWPIFWKLRVFSGGQQQHQSLLDPCRRTPLRSGPMVDLWKKLVGKLGIGQKYPVKYPVKYPWLWDDDIFDGWFTNVFWLVYHTMVYQKVLSNLHHHDDSGEVTSATVPSPLPQGTNLFFFSGPVLLKNMGKPCPYHPWCWHIC